jgi:pimeloyl-ACP methyl ester carboxylesterase
MVLARVMMLPGSVLPAEPAFAALLAALGPGVDAFAKDLEVYSGDEPLPDYSLDTEIGGVVREADARGWERFHLVGYSGGGAAALAFAARHPQRLLSLALLEPAWAGNWDWTAEHTALWAEYDQIMNLPPEQFMRAFMALGVRPRVTLPQAPAGDPPAWMAKRPAGIAAFIQTFKTYDLDRAALNGFQQPVYFALGGLSNPVEYGENAERLAAVFPNFQLEVYEDRHHFDPPHRIEPERLAASLRGLWQRA